jgi:cation diffusion facilitator CzcD-associated flavoprotein CzcO
MSFQKAQTTQQTRVAVIGAGAAGLIAARYVLPDFLRTSTDFHRYLLAEGLHVMIYERKSEVGGLWNSYDQLFPSNAWDNLNTNVPRHLMTFSGHRWQLSTPLFPGKDDVAGYLQSLAEGLLTKYPNNLQPRRRREVIRLRHVLQASGRVRWETTAQNHDMDVFMFGVDMNMPNEVDNFDFVVISNGIYTKAFVPNYEGIQDWRVRFGATESHVNTFRNTNDFQSKAYEHVLRSDSNI